MTSYYLSFGILGELKVSEQIPLILLKRSDDQMNKLIILCLTYLVILIGCKSSSFVERTRSNKSVKYFRSFASYKLPIEPIYEIAEPDPADAYYKALYDNAGKLVQLDKYYHEKIISQVLYFYDSDDRIVKSESTNPSDPNSQRVEKYFNSSGKFIKAIIYDSQGHLIKEEVIK